MKKDMAALDFCTIVWSSAIFNLFGNGQVSIVLHSVGHPKLLKNVLIRNASVYCVRLLRSPLLHVLFIVSPLAI